MALEEIYSQFNPSKMRTQLSEFNGGANSYSGYPYQYGHGHGINTPMSTQLVTMKEDYRNASLMSYAEKLDLLMEVQEESGGRSVNPIPYSVSGVWLLIECQARVTGSCFRAV